jgi:hypothetical protein
MLWETCLKAITTLTGMYVYMIGWVVYSQMWSINIHKLIHGWISHYVREKYDDSQAHEFHLIVMNQVPKLLT